MERSVHFDCGPLRLEGRLFVPDQPRAACVICHPHPLYGGAMDNNVVVAISRSLGQAGAATLRFNFRGVGASTGAHDNGRGEAEDVRAALSFLLRESSQKTATLAGYSFGAAMALIVAGDAAVERVIAVAPPLAMGASVPADLAKPLLLLAGDRDPYCPIDQAEALAARPDVTVGRIAGADHFFFGREAELAEAATAFASG